MSANHRISTWAIVMIAALLLTACNPLPSEPEVHFTAPVRPAPLLSIHNPLVIPTGDTPASAGGPFYGWQSVENEQHGLTIFYPNGWFFASSQEELLSLLPQLADAYLKGRTSYLETLMPPGQEPLLVGTGFPFDATTPPTGHQRLPAPHRAQRRSDLGSVCATVGRPAGKRPGLRQWRASRSAPVCGLGESRPQPSRYRIDGALAFGERAGAIPDTNALGRQVVLLSPDRATFLTVTFDVWGEYPQWLERLMLEVVRRVQWMDNPAYDATARTDRDAHIAT